MEHPYNRVCIAQHGDKLVVEAQGTGGIDELRSHLKQDEVLPVAVVHLMPHHCMKCSHPNQLPVYLCLSTHWMLQIQFFGLRCTAVDNSASKRT